MKTHQVLDLHYLPEEGQVCFDGTLQECNAFAATQTPHFMYVVVPMLKKEIEAHPDNQVKLLKRDTGELSSELRAVLEKMGDKAYTEIRSWLYDRANSFAPNVKALHLHSACNDLIPVIDELDPNYFKH